MKKTKILLFILLNCFIIQQTVNAQIKTITLNYCYKKLTTNYPIEQNNKILKNSLNIALNNIGKNWMPNINLTGQLSTQNDAISMLDKDKYQIALNLEQKIYDGGITKTQKKIEIQNNKIQKLNNKIYVYNLRIKVNELFFKIILSKKQIEILNIGLENLKVNLNAIKSSVQNGIRLKSDILQIESEIISIETEIKDYQNNIKAYINMLSELINENIDSNANFKIPKNIQIHSRQFFQVKKRLEFSLFDANKQKTDYLNELNENKNKPLFSSFMQLGYGKPGLNMFENKDDKFAIIGFNLKWKIYDWKKTKNIIKLNNNFKNIIQNEKESFNKELKIKIIELHNEINNLKYKIKQDNKLIKNRKDILKSVDSQYKNGIITTTEYITNSNLLLNAKKILKLHETQLQFTQINFKTLIGEEL